VVKVWKQAKADRALAERYRLLYVAMTRARDELYVFGSTGQKSDKEKNWHITIARAFETADPECKTVPIPYKENHIIRHGAEPKWLESVESKQTVATEIPAWATTLVSKTRPTRSPFLAARDDSTGDTEAAKRGVAIHRILEVLDGVADSTRESVARRHAKRLGLDEADIMGILKFLALPDSVPFFAQGSSAEVDLRGTLPSGEKVNSRVDRLAIESGTTWLLDYKTGPRQSLNPDHAYVKQMAKYAWLLREAKPGTEVKAALLWTQTGVPVWLDAALLSRSFERMMQSTS
jgi:ATP-dependent helicase/nuclease subunit A